MNIKSKLPYIKYHIRMLLGIFHPKRLFSNPILWTLRYVQDEIKGLANSLKD